MILFLIVSCIVLGIAIKFSYDKGAEVRAVKAKEKAKALAAAEHKDLSLVSRELMKDYASLPADHRPAVDLKAALMAMDKTYGISNLDDHFGYRGRSFRRSYDYGYMYDTVEDTFNSWNCDCHKDGYYDYDDQWVDKESTKCDFEAYHELHDEFLGLRTALTEQERVLELAENSHGFDTVGNVLAELRSNRALVTEVTREVEARVDTRALQDS